MKKYLEIAKFTKTQGLKGELRAEYYCDYPEEIGEFSELYLGAGKTPVTPEYVRAVKNIAVIKLKGVDSATTAAEFTGEMLYLNREDIELPENTWFIQDLIGLSVIDADSGREYGKVKEILQNAPTDVYVVAAEDGRELLFPSIPEVLTDTDVEKGIIQIRPLDGLFDI